jgi:protochlorophyllide reductase
MQMIFGGSSKSIIGNKNLCVITGTSSGLGRETLRALLKKGNYFVVCAVRDVKKMEEVIKMEGFDESSLKILELDLGSFDSTKKFVTKLRDFKKNKGLDRLVCNAAVYQPSLPTVNICGILNYDL